MSYMYMYMYIVYIFVLCRWLQYFQTTERIVMMLLKNCAVSMLLVWKLYLYLLRAPWSIPPLPPFPPFPPVVLSFTHFSLPTLLFLHHLSKLSISLYLFIVPSQCIVSRTLSKKQMLMSVATKICLQLNCKLGGELWALEVPVCSNNYVWCY